MYKFFVRCINIYTPTSEAMKFYMIMPASLVTASNQLSERSREDSYSVLNDTMQSTKLMISGQVTSLFVGGASECRVSS